MKSDTGSPRKDSKTPEEQPEKVQQLTEEEPKKTENEQKGDKKISQPKCAQNPASSNSRGLNWERLSTIIITIFTGCLVVTSWLQWKSTHAAADAAKKSTEIMLQMAETADKANKLARERFLVNIRPWVGGAEISARNVDVGHTPTVFFKFRNYGNSPATAVSVKSGAMLIERQIEKDTDTDLVGEIDGIVILKLLETIPANQVGTVFPGQMFGGPSRLGGELSEENMDRIMKGLTKLIGIGEITYLDGAGEQHQTWVHSEYNPDAKEMTLFRAADLPQDY